MGKGWIDLPALILPDKSNTISRTRREALATLRVRRLMPDMIMMFISLSEHFARLNAGFSIPAAPG